MKELYLLFLLMFCMANTLKPQNNLEVHVQSGHQVNIHSVAFSPDGRLAVTGGADHSAKLWDTRTGLEIRTFSGHRNDVSSVVFSPDGNYVLSGSFDNTLILWNVKTGKNIKTFEGHKSTVMSVAISSDGKFALSGSLDNTIKLWDISNGIVIKTFKGHTANVNSVAFSNDGLFAASSSLDKTVRLWDISSGVELKKFENEKIASDVAFSTDGRMILFAGGDNSAKLWFLKTGLVNYIPHSVGVTAAAFSKDGSFFVCGTTKVKGYYSKNPEIQSDSSTIIIWDAKTYKKIKSLKNCTLGVSAISISPDGRKVIASYGATLGVWDIDSGEKIYSFSSASSTISSVALSGDNRIAISGSTDKTIKIWDLCASRLKGIYKSHRLYPLIALSPNGDVVADGTDLWKISTLRQYKKLDFLGNPYSVDFSSDGDFILIGGDKDFKLYSVKKDSPLKYFSVHTEEKNNSNKNQKKIGYTPGGDRISVAFFPDGKRALSGSWHSKSLSIWDIETGKEICTLKEQKDISCVKISPDGNFALSGSWDKTIKIWDINTSKEIRTFSGHSYSISSVAFLPDGKQFISGSWDNTIKLWDIATGKAIKTFTGHTDRINSVAVSVDGKYVLSGSDDNTIRLWSLNDDSWIAFLGGSGEYSKDWIIYTQDGYWDGSANCGRLIAIVQETECWSVDQFAIRNNRPDIILQRIGVSDKELINHFYSQWQKRIRKLGFTNAKGQPDETLLSSEIHIPISAIDEAKQDGKFVDLKLSLNDSKYNLKRYNIYINDVPLYGSYGKPITGKTQKINERVELSYGTNKIEVSCINAKGAESIRELAYCSYVKSVKKDLYILAFGVSKYQNPSFNLQYADKDALDLEKVMQGFKDKGFENVYTKILTNEQVTPNAIKASKDFVKNAKPDDTFILFIAGHGMHDKDAEATYYFLTSNADVNNLKGTAADFETIEDLLQGIPPRNKLFLMDACESGEIDEEDQGQMIATATGAGISSRGFKSTNTVTLSGSEGSKTKRSYLYQKDRYIYNDLVRRSGAIVFSSSKGGELSYERSDIGNGLFTEYIMKALTTTETDKDGNGTVSTDELREYVSIQVAKASGDLQHPTVDRDNIYQKFGFGVK